MQLLRGRLLGMPTTMCGPVASLTTWLKLLPARESVVERNTVEADRGRQLQVADRARGSI